MAAQEVINTAKKFRNLLTRGEVKIFERSTDIEGFSSDLHYLAGIVNSRLAQEGGGERKIDLSAILQQQQDFQNSQNPQQEPSSEQPTISDSFGEGVLAAGGLALTPLFNKDDTQSQVIQDFHRVEQEVLTKDLSQKYESIHATLGNETGTSDEQVEKLAQKLTHIVQPFQTDELLQRDVTNLKARLESAGVITPELSKHIDDKHLQLQEKQKSDREKAIANAKKKGKQYQDPEAIDTKALAKRLLKAKTPQEREKILRFFVDERQGYTYYSLRHILTRDKRSFLGFGDQSIFNKQSRKTLLEKGKKEQKERATKQKAEEQTKRNDLLRFLRLRRVKVQRENIERTPAGITETPSQNTPSNNRGFSLIDGANNAFNALRDLQNIGDLVKNFSKLFGGGAAPEAAGAGAAGVGGGTVALIIGIIIGILLLIVLFFVFMNNYQKPTADIRQEQCGDFSQQIDVDTFPDTYAGLQNTLFHVEDYGRNYKSTLTPSQYQQALSSYKDVFHTLCILYGHTLGGLSGSDTYNTFAKLLLGDRLISQNGKTIFLDEMTQANLGKHPKAKIIRQYVTFDDKNQSCFLSFQPNESEGSKITSIFVNPQLCSHYQLQYLISQSLAHAIIIQQHIVTGDTTSIFHTFNTNPPPTGIMGQDGLLPSPSCQGQPSRVFGNITGGVSKGVGENETDEQNRNCFADMIADYLTYAKYIAGNSQLSIPATTTVAPSTTPTGSNTFEQFPAAYPNYYNFARNNIFDGQVFFYDAAASTGGIGCPTAEPTDAKTITADLQSYFNISIKGPNTDIGVMKDIYHTVCKLGGYKFIQLLGVPKTHIDIFVSLGQDCSGHSKITGQGVTDQGSNSYSVDYFSPCKTSAGNEFLITHELGHIIQFRNQDLERKFCVGPYGGTWVKFGQDYGCTSSQPQLPTYNCQLDYGRGPFLEECFSDMVGEFFTYHNFLDGVNGQPADVIKMSDYPKNFPQYYQFAQDNIFTSSSPTNVKANGNTCNGKYPLNNPRAANFGDPSCDYDKNLLYNLLLNAELLFYTPISNSTQASLATSNAAFWFNIVIPCESSYDPNAFTLFVGNTHTPDPNGAWGLFQMSGTGLNGQYDHGDVFWKQQVTNAINYNHKVIGTNWRYWDCARPRWN